MELTPGEWQELEVPRLAAGQRLDLFLPRAFPELSRARAQKLIEEGLVTLDDKPTRASYKLEGAEKLRVFLPPPKPTKLAAQDIPLTILFQDDDLAVIDKPAGLVVHPAAGHADGTLVNSLLHHFPSLAQGTGIGGELRPGIVHRIDRNTSGVLLITKTDRAHRALAEQFAKHTISRRYLGLAWGELPLKGEWEGAIGRDPKERKRMAIVKTGGKPAHTRFRRLALFPGPLSYFEAELLTGRTHQIRVHFSAHGFPLAGDSIYGDHPRSLKLRRETASRALAKKMPEAATLLDMLMAAGRQFLHAAHLGFTHPVSGERLELESPLPAELLGVLKNLEDGK